MLRVEIIGGETSAALRVYDDDDAHLCEVVELDRDSVLVEGLRQKIAEVVDRSARRYYERQL